MSVAWGGWWAALAVSRLLPSVVRSTVGAIVTVIYGRAKLTMFIGVVAVGTRKYIDWLGALHRYVALTAWTLAVWISYNPLIDSRQESTASTKSKSIISFLSKLMFGVFLCAAVLLFEKFSIQWIAGKFHEKTYAGAFHSSLVMLSSNISTRTHRRPEVCCPVAHYAVSQFLRHPWTHGYA